MARRALRKLDPQLLLTDHLKALDELPVPLDPALLFSQEAPLEIEVGSGKGMFLAAAAMASLERNFLGVEVSAKYARFAAAKLAKAGCGNAVMLHGDGLRLFHNLPAACAAAVHVYFPDPWWKKRHKKRRVLNESLLRDIQRTLQVQGSFHFWTDVQEYFESTLELIAATTTLQGFSESEPPDAGAASDAASQARRPYRTHFDRRTQMQGLPVYRAEFRHREAALPYPAKTCAS